jgi:hypothetical protein
MRPFSYPLAAYVLIGTPSGLLANAEVHGASGLDQIKVTAVSSDPIAPSGILATAVEVTGEANGRQTIYYIPFMEKNQPKPRIGQTCEISWQWHDAFLWITPRGGVRGVRLVSKYKCEDEKAGPF